MHLDAGKSPLYLRVNTAACRGEWRARFLGPSQQCGPGMEGWGSWGLGIPAEWNLEGVVFGGKEAGLNLLMESLSSRPNAGCGG